MSASEQDGTFVEFPSVAAKGMGMGIAEIIPGVSGGTIAYITGIYIRLLDAIKSVNVRALKALIRFDLRGLFAQLHWRFLLMLGIGQLAGALLCTKVIPLPSLLETHPEPVLGLFFGLVCASVLLLAREGGVPGLGGLGCYALGAFVGYLVISSVPGDTPEEPWFIFCCGLIAICSWILPGISGSYVLLLLKKYQYVMNGLFMSNGQPVLDNMLYIALPFGAGALIGIAVASRLLSRFMHKYERQATMAMTGLLAVTLYAIFPFQRYVKEEFVVRGEVKEKIISSHAYWPNWEHLQSMRGILAMALMLAGFVLILFVDVAVRKRKTMEKSV